jgi:N-acyl-D-amino-acid deacylase
MRRSILRRMTSVVRRLRTLLAGSRVGEADVGQATQRGGPEVLDGQLEATLLELGVPGAGMAIIKKGRIVHARGFGYANLERQEPATADTLFRIASMSKPITATAIMLLVRHGRLRLDDSLGDLLDLAPPPGVRLDPRWRQVTVRQLLQHTGGWDQSRSGDPLYMIESIRRDLELDGPVRPEDAIRWMMYRPLDFDPGTRYAYSCFGYTVLGRVIEQVAAVPYEMFVRREVLAPLGLERPRLGRSLARDADPGEATYYTPDGATAPAVVGPQRGEPAPLPYGTWSMEAMDSRGGWIISAADLARFAAAFQRPDVAGLLTRPEIESMWAPPAGLAGRHENGLVRGSYYGMGWSVRRVNDHGDLDVWHTGLFSGSAGFFALRHDGLGWVLLMNSRHDKTGRKELNVVLEPLMYSLVGQVGDWPDRECSAEVEDSAA